MTEELRTERMVFRMTTAEKTAIEALAAVHGIPPSTFCRHAALGTLPRPGSPAGAVLSTVNAALTPAGEVVASNEGAKQEQPPADPRVEAEVAEAKLEDEPARTAYIERRSRELFGQGKTTRVAEVQAAEEWDQRGL